MKLIASSTSVGNATIPIRWCISINEVEYLKENKILNPHLLIVTINRGKEMERRLVPLNQMLTYLPFSRPGENKVAASIVWDSYGVKVLKKRYLRKDSYGEYILQILNYDGKLDFGYSYAEISVNVAKEFFAKDPAKWEKWWVNLWFETEQRDQCQFRKRRFLAYSIQPFVVLVSVIVITLFRTMAAAFWFLVLTKRKVSLGAVFHPFKNKSSDVWSYAKHTASFFMTDAKGEDRPITIQCLYPPILLIMATVLFVVNAIFSFHIWWLYLILASPLAILIILVIVEVAISLADLAVKQLKSTKKREIDEAKRVKRLRDQQVKKQQKAKKERLELEARLRALEKSYADITCDGTIVADLTALPKEKQTIHLRFLDLKARVCKPYAR